MVEGGRRRTCDPRALLQTADETGVETGLGKYECERVGGERSGGVKGRHVQQMGASGDTVT